MPEVSPRAESYYPIELFETMGLKMVNAPSDHHHHTPPRSLHAPTFLQMFGKSGAEGVQFRTSGIPKVERRGLGLGGVTPWNPRYQYQYQYKQAFEGRSLYLIL